MVDNELLIKINASTKGFNEALESAKEKTEDLDENLKKVAAISGVAFAALTAEVGLSAKAFEESEAASRKLTQSLQNQGMYSRELVDNYKKQAAALQDLTGIDDDSIVASQAILQGLIGRVTITKEMTAAAVELGVASGGDASQGAEILGRAIEGNTRVLKQFGIEIDENLSKQDRMTKIIDQVTQKLGGQAAAANQGLGGIKGLRSAFGDLQEEIGSRFAPVIGKAIEGLTSFFKAAKENETLVNLSAGLIGAGIAITGLISGLAALGVAFTSASAIAAAFGTTLTIALGPIGLAAAAITALGAATGIYLSSAGKAKDETTQLQVKIKELSSGIQRLEEIANNPVRSVFSEQAKEDLPKMREELAKYQEQLKKVQAQQSAKGEGGTEQNEAKAESARKAEALANAAEARRLATIRANNEAILLESQHASTRAIELKKEEAQILGQIEDDKNAKVRDALQSRLEIVRQQEEQQRALENQQRSTYFNEILAQNEEFAALSAEQQAQLRQQQDQALQGSLQTESTTRMLAAQQSLQQQIEAHNRLLAEEQKYGTAYALISKAMHSEVYQGSKQAFGELAQLQQSSNSTLKEIGKAAAVANIIIKTGESAMNIYAGFSTIPIIGPALGVAGAAAAIAFGAEQVGRVTGAAEGGLLQGGIPGVDSIPVLAQHNELVSPAQNFEEVIGSVRAQREAEKIQERLGTGEGGGTAHVILSLKDDLMDFIEAKFVERQNLRISLQGA